jgi:hypothetical protein
MTWTVDSSGTKTPTVAGTCTISIASPAVIAMTNTCAAGDQVVFTTTGALPTGLTAGTTYYVLSSGLSSSSFQVSATPGGSAINTSGSQSGTQTAAIEHILDTPTTNGTYILAVDAVNMALGDLTELRVYDMVDGTNLRQAWKATFQHVQANPAKQSPPLAITAGAKFSIKQLAGTARSFPWVVRRI